jgi:hypothetical protein
MYKQIQNNIKLCGTSTLLQSAYFPSTWPKTLRQIWLNLRLTSKIHQKYNFVHRHVKENHTYSLYTADLNKNSLHVPAL